MDLVRFGRGIRALRMRRKWRQLDLARAAGISQTAVARIERGGGDTVPPRKLERVAAALGARVDLRLNYNGEALDRYLDAGHAAIVELVAQVLRRYGWEVIAEATFSIRGERGSVDVLGWHGAARVALIVEVKSVVPDVQAMLMSIDRKGRLARDIAQARGWSAVATARLLVIGGGRTSRRRVAAHSATFEQTFPDRSVAVRRWLAQPTAASALRGLWFAPASRGVTPRHRVASPYAPIHAQPASSGRPIRVRESSDDSVSRPG